MALKIPQLLVQYLYKNRSMSLPGLGIFTLDKSITFPDEGDRVQLSMPNGVQFQNANIVAADKELISFICENTGKIKPLAISDLDSYLNLGTEMLNIGKPFYLEGIGTITKGKTGRFDFTPGDYSVMKENNGGQDSDRKKYAKDKMYVQDKQPAGSNENVPNRGALKWVALFAALIIVGLGGWLMYKKNPPAIAENIIDTTAVSLPAKIMTDSVVTESSHTDSARVPVTVTNTTEAPGTVTPETTYKFVILTTPDKERAMKRYKQLIDFDLKAHISTKDTTNFKVYFQFPASPRDTTHIKDSLRREYAHAVQIEQ